MLQNEDLVNETLQSAQWEIVEQEVFSELIKEAGSLPTTEARVSERLIVIEAAQDVELRFELVGICHLFAEIQLLIMSTSRLTAS